MKNFAHATSTVIGKSYELGKMDCFSMVRKLMENYGFSIAENEEFRGLTLNNYAEKYKQNHSVVYDVVDYLAQTFDEVPVNRTIAGDVLLVKNKHGEPLLCIDAGNGLVMTAIVGEDVRLLKASLYTKIKALRWATQ